MSRRSSNKHVSAIKLKAIFQEHAEALRLLSRLNCEGIRGQSIIIQLEILS